MKKFFADISPYGKVQAIDFDEHSIPSTDVKDLRSDNGGEHISKDAEELLVQMQIKHSYTSPYSPHQNGRAERNWRTLFDMARAMLIESAMPIVTCSSHWLNFRYPSEDALKMLKKCTFCHFWHF